MTRPIISSRQLVVIAIIVALVGLFAAMSLNSQRAVGAPLPKAAATDSPAGLVDNDLARQVSAQLSASGSTYAETKCPNFTPDLSLSPVLTCTALENDKPISIDVHFDRADEFTAKVLRAA